MSDLRARAIDCLLDGRMAEVAVARDWELLREIAALAQADAPTDLLPADTELFKRWREAVTRYHLSGWSRMTPENVERVAATQSGDDC